MNKQEPALVILAAGMGSRFGGMKQITPLGDNGELIIDFSVFDAIRAGFKKIVFIIKEENEADFERLIGGKVRPFAEVQYVYQSMSDLPENIARFAAQSIVNWVQGISDFCDADQMPANSIYFVRRLRMEAYLVTIGLYNREELNALTKKHATKGGICERSGIFFNEQCKDMMTKAFSDYLDGNLDEAAWWATWRQKGQDAALVVARHAACLAD